MGTIDISKIVSDEIACMDAEELIEGKIRENVRKAVLGGIEGALGSYRLRSLIQDKLQQQLPDIVEHIGLDGYNQFLADTVKEIAVFSIKNEAKEVIAETVTDVFCKKYETYRLSDILKEWKAYVDPEDEDERVERNEKHDGYTLRIRRSMSSSGYFENTTIYLDELGDHPKYAKKDEFEFVIELSRYADSMHKTLTIKHVYIYGVDIVHSIRDVTGKFRGLLANLFINKTEIVDDVGKIDEDDHYYETDEG